MTPHHGEILFRLLLAAILGALVGFEREVHGRPAGIRTYLILCLGSALIMVLSEYLSYGLVEKLPPDTLRVDPGPDCGPGHHRHRFFRRRGDPQV